MKKCRFILICEKNILPNFLLELTPGVNFISPMVQGPIAMAHGVGLKRHSFISSTDLHSTQPLQKT
jgi:hypothetical protein